MRPGEQMSDPVDWSLARRIGRRFAPSGPEMQMHEARGVVSELREDAEQAREHVLSITGMQTEPGHPAVVVDRGDWIDSNVAAMGRCSHCGQPRRTSTSRRRRVPRRSVRGPAPFNWVRPWDG